MCAGQKLVRINLSEQTDMMDLLGADLPVEGGAPGQFAWSASPPPFPPPPSQPCTPSLPFLSRCHHSHTSVFCGTAWTSRSVCTVECQPVLTILILVLAELLLHLSMSLRAQTVVLSGFSNMPT